MLIDNYDSFVYNLEQAIGIIDDDLTIVRNDSIDLNNLKQNSPDKVVISPGPKGPTDAGQCKEVITNLIEKDIPILGICLGHQVIAHTFGGTVSRLEVPIHGKVSSINHNNNELFKGVTNNFQATRYHSLTVSKTNFPENLNITAASQDGEIMAIEHKDHPIYGLQFHPESIMTDEGGKIIKNFLEL